jgi:hypothetical protein
MSVDKYHAIKRGWLRPVEVRLKRKDKDGYWLITVVDHYIVGTTRIYEHRLVMAEKLGRRLTSKEHVHHDKIKRRTYNHPLNLKILSSSEHTALHNKERVVSKETRAKMRAKALGNKRALGHNHTQETRDQIRRSHTGVLKGPHSARAKRNISRSLVGRKLTEVHKKRISAGLRRHHS